MQCGRRRDEWGQEHVREADGDGQAAGQVRGVGVRGVGLGDGVRVADDGAVGAVGEGGGDPAGAG
ncbi:hypothetical protein GCM10027072_51030 [Streptomyces bullii]